MPRRILPIDQLVAYTKPASGWEGRQFVVQCTMKEHIRGANHRTRAGCPSWRTVFASDGIDSALEERPILCYRRRTAGWAASRAPIIAPPNAKRFAKFFDYRRPV